MAEQKLVAEPREGTGKGVARKLRAAGRVPAVMYGHGTESTALSVDAGTCSTSCTPAPAATSSWTWSWTDPST